MSGVKGMRWQWHMLRPCGTRAAYRRHLRHDEDPCFACKKAEADARRGWRNRVRQS